MRVDYCCDNDKRAYEQYYTNQCGQGMPVFYGARTQRGSGIGSIFSGLFRSIFPLVKKFAPVIGKKALQTGVQIVGDVAAGQSLKEAAKTHVTNALNDGINSIEKFATAQSGSGHRPKRKNAAKKKKQKKRPKHDIFS